MTSLIDFDQGGTFRTSIPTYMGPSVGWIRMPSSVLPIIAAGTYQLQVGVTLVTVNVVGAVTIKLPSALNPVVPAGAQPSLYDKLPVTIVDIGGNASSHPITIQPFSILETVVSLASIQITVNYGAFTLQPIPSATGWSSISP